MSAQTTAHPPPPARSTAQQRDRAFEREICDSLELFHVCPTSECWRSRSCRGDPARCIERHAGYFSKELREWIDAMREAKDDGFGVAAAIEETEPYVDALVTWVLGLQCGCYARQRRAAR